MDYSVLMAVYFREDPAFFRQSIESILSQTKKTNDFVIVCDGPLSKELYSTINYFLQSEKNLQIVYLPENKGLGNALRVGLDYCRNEFVARMDSDDISDNRRCEMLLDAFNKDASLSVVGSDIMEFVEDPKRPYRVMRYPRSHDDVMRRIKRRNPFGHPSVMFRKSKVIEAGNYQDFYLLEDYFLWARILKNNGKGKNLPICLLYMRTSPKLYERRGGKKYFRSNLKLQKYLLANKLTNYPNFVLTVAARFIVQTLMPNFLRKFFYLHFLRKKN